MSRAKRHLTGRDVIAPRGHCRWCKKPVRPPRQSWCSQECVEEYLIRGSAGRARAAVLARDHGICAACGLDCEALRKAISEARPVWARPEWPEVKTLLSVLGFNPNEAAQADRSLWEADHITPVVEGGGACGLDNLRTLCLPCHRVETKALARRRAEARRGAAC